MTTNGRRLWCLMLAACCVGCARAEVPVKRSLVRPGPSNSTFLSGPELTSLGISGNLLSALQQARPWFLRSRGSTVMVIVDRSAPMDVSVLESLSVRETLDVTLVRASSLMTLAGFGSDGRVIVGDVLVVRTHRR